ncbi:hypothetical protein FHS27_001301 [Rhodopirellula rubra]|uniref:Uncharacterized protein n=1 Tax=Aporhodopirellula rubra TaxID=980271 RepID=A0A7W5DVW5_9BACT|nr:hypothetical protein [Aporhodopirellula rubra]MBB3205501.1 hypothetical protein [Aporhodopirellula rubra]
MKSEISTWSPDSICLKLDAADSRPLAKAMYERTCRTDFSQPGFCVVDAGSEIDSISFRRLMLELKREMAAIHEVQTGKTLVHLSAARFDQQETTRPHLDGGPDECFLMLGYEPSAVDSDLQITDYTKCAFDLGLTPKELLVKHNPMFQSSFEILEPYSTRVPCFSKTNYQIICINNSSAGYSSLEPAWQGTLHTATILTPDEDERRVINSTMIASVPKGTPDTIDASVLNEFASTSAVRRRGYDKPHLDDDD